MKINRITSVPFTQKKANEQKVWQPKTYYTNGTTVTLTAKEEALYITSLEETYKNMRSWMLLGAGIGLGAGSIFSGKLKSGVFVGLIGGVAGMIGGFINAIITGKAQYISLPQDKIEIENGLARQNLAAINLKEVKNEN